MKIQLLNAMLLAMCLYACQPDETEEDPGSGLPAAEFSATQIDEITFEFESLQGGSAHSWDFGDGNTTTGKKVEHAYTRAGDFEVTLTTTTDEGDRIGTKTVSPNPDNTFLLSRGWVITESQRDGAPFPGALGANYRFFRDGSYTAGTLDGFTWEWTDDNEKSILTNKNTSYANTWFIEELSTQEWRVNFEAGGLKYEYLFTTTD